MSLYNIIPRLEDESETIFCYRINYIEKNYKITDSSNTILCNLIVQSKILANIKFKKCVYEMKIYNTLKEFL